MKNKKNTLERSVVLTDSGLPLKKRSESPLTRELQQLQIQDQQTSRVMPKTMDQFQNFHLLPLNIIGTLYEIAANQTGETYNKLLIKKIQQLLAQTPLKQVQVVEDVHYHKFTKEQLTYYELDKKEQKGLNRQQLQEQLLQKNTVLCQMVNSVDLDTRKGILNICSHTQEEEDNTTIDNSLRTKEDNYDFQKMEQFINDHYILRIGTWLQFKTKQDLKVTISTFQNNIKQKDDIRACSPLDQITGTTAQEYFIGTVDVDGVQIKLTKEEEDTQEQNTAFIDTEGVELSTTLIVIPRNLPNSKQLVNAFSQILLNVSELRKFRQKNKPIEPVYKASQFLEDFVPSKLIDVVQSVKKSNYYKYLQNTFTSYFKELYTNVKQSLSQQQSTFLKIQPRDLQKVITQNISQAVSQQNQLIPKPSKQDSASGFSFDDFVNGFSSVMDVVTKTTGTIAQQAGPLLPLLLA